MKHLYATVTAAALMAAMSAAPALAQPDVNLMEGVTVRAGDNPVVEEGKFKKDCPWVIGMSAFGVNANTWTVQVAHESEAEAARQECVSKFILLDANLNQNKQVADIEDLIAQGVDAIIVQPVTSTSANASIAKATAAGIPVVLHTGRIESDAYTTEIQGGADHAGKVMGEWLAEKVGDGGKIWVLRGLAGHPEDTNRYNGFRSSIEGKNIEIVAEDYGDWQYDKAKNLCETLYISNPEVDGIWSSGADMSRACIDVLKQFGATIPPITGEGNNGYFGQWISDNLESIAFEYGPNQGAAGIRAAVALLEGKSLYKHYDYNPEGWGLEKVKKYYREDLSPNTWWPSELPEEKLVELYGVR